MAGAVSGPWVAGLAATVAGLALLTALLPHRVPAGVVAQGAVFGAVTGLLALGLVLVYQVNRVINFAYGAMGGVAATLGVLLYQEAGWPWPAAMLIAVAVGVALGAVVERLVIRPFRDAPRLVLTVATVGLAQVLGGVQLLLPGAFHRSPLMPTFRTPLNAVTLRIDPILLTGNDLLVLAVVPAVLVGLSAFLLRTDAGRAVRASAENAERAQLLGIPVHRLSSLVWALIGGLAALTLTIKAPSEGLVADAAAGPAALLPALAAAVVGRMSSLPRAFAAGVALGVVDLVVRWNVDKQSVTTVVFLAVILLALLLPGWLGARAEEAEESSWSLARAGRRLPDAVARLPEMRATRVLPVALAGLAAAIFPLVATPSVVNRGSSILILGLVAVSLVVLTGWGGTISLGQLAIVGAGGVIAANLLARLNLDLFLTIAAAGVAGALVAVLVGLPALRVRGLFLAVTTLALAVAVDSFFLNPRNFGELIPSSFDRPVLWKRFDLLSERPMYYLCLGTLVVAVLAVRSLRATRAGRVLLAARDNPRAASAMGIPVVRVRLSGFVLSGVLAGVAGALHVLLLRGMGFHTYEPTGSLLVFSMAVIGGIGSVGGALVGVALVEVSAQLFPQLQLLITGTGLLLVLYLVPGGAVQALESARDGLARLAARRRGLRLALPSERVQLRSNTAVSGHASEGGAAPAPGGAAPAPGGAAPAPGGAAPASDGTAPVPVGPPLLRCRDVSASYGLLQVLFGVDLDVSPGEILALLGTNGAGKSTLLRTVVGLVPRSAGTVELEGASVRGLSTDRIARAGVTLMPGGRGLFATLTVDEHLRLAGWTLRGDREAAAEARAGMLALFPVLSDRLRVRGGDLSGGEQQMLSLAMALLTRPRVLLIDELSLGLAPAVVAQLGEKVLQIRETGTTVVLVEQSVDVAAELADRAVFLEKGRVWFSGPTRELLGHPELLRSVFLGGRTRDTTSAEDPAPTAPPNGSAARAAPAAPAGVELACHGIRKHFGGVVALDGVDLVVAPGRAVGLVGHNGAGKTTLFDVLGGFTTPDEGQVVLDGQDVTGFAPHHRALAGLGRSFQEARLFPGLTVAETVAVALERHLPNRDPLAAALGLPAALDAEAAARERVDELLDLLGLSDYRHHRTAELSTGTRRIVELACVLAQRPAVVLLDEPSAGIAQRETEALGPLLRRVQAGTGCSLLVIDHDVDLLLAACDELVALELGRVVTSGEPREVLEHPQVVASYIGAGRSASRS